MSGSVEVTLGWKIRDTIRAHGLAWAAKNAAKRGLPLWMFVALAGLPARKTGLLG